MAESLVTSDVGDVLANFQALWAARMVYVANFALAITEYFILLDKEDTLVWATKPSISMMKMAFYLNRYVQFFSAGLLFFQFCIFDGFNIPLCEHTLVVAAVLVNTQFCFCQAFMLYRAYIVWGRSRVVGGICGVTFTSTQVIEFYNTIKWANSSMFVPNTLQSSGCILALPGRLLNDFYALLASETCALALLTSRILLHHYRVGRFLGRNLHNSQSVFTTMLNDGMAYFVCIALLTIGNIFVDMFVKNPIRPVFVCLQGTIQNILCIRMLFHITDKHFAPNRTFQVLTSETGNQGHV